MPLPTPRQDENQAEFISRCVPDENVQTESADNDQAIAICTSIYDDSQERSNMTVNEKLLAAIKGRNYKETPFGNGILTADAYVRTLQECVGTDACYKYMANRHKSYDDILRKASQTLVYSNPDMEVEEISYAKQAGANVTQLENGIELPKNTLMVFRHVLTTPRKDRDGDILRTQGAIVDPKMLLLWQHVHTLPIGKMLLISEHNSNKLVLVSAIVDMNELSHDSAVMVDNGMGRFSHGFRALEFDTLKEDEGSTTGPGGFDIKRFEIMEESLVSVPSNTDANTDEILLSLAEGGKLTSDIMKDYAVGVRAKRPTQSSVTYKEVIGDGSSKFERTITADNAADFESVFKTTNKENKDEDKPTDGSGEKTNSNGTSTPKEANATSNETERQKDNAGNAEIKHVGGPLDGSWEDIEHKLQHQIKGYLNENGVSIDEGSWAWLVGTFADHAVVCLEKPQSGVEDEFRYFKIGWEMQVDGPQFKGEPVPVEVETTTVVRRRSPAFDSKDTKAGRTLSAVNKQKLEDVKADVEELSEKEADMTRSGHAICDRCVVKLGAVIDSATPAEEETGTTPDVKQAMAIVISQASESQRKHLTDVFSAMEKAQQSYVTTKQYRTLVGAK